MYKVLIVDDEDIIKIGLKTILDWEEMGYEIVGTAGDGIEALRMMEKLSPDLIITDIMMPKMNGIELLETLKENGYQGKSVVLSNYGEVEYVKKAIKLGAEDYILKVAYSKEELANLFRKISLSLKETRNVSVFTVKAENNDEESEYQTFLILLPEYVKDIENVEYIKFSKKIKTILEEILGNKSGLEIFFREKNQVVVMFETGGEKLPENTNIPVKIEKTLALYIMLKSSVIYGLNSKGKNEAEKTLEKCIEKSIAAFYGDIVSNEKEIKFEKISDIFNFITITNRYRGYIKEWKFEKMQDEIQSMILNFQEKMVEPYEVKDFIRQIIIAMQLYFDETYQIEILDGYRNAIHECRNIKELYELFNQSMEEINQRIMELSLQKEDLEATERIKKYIRKNIDSKLSLNEIAEMIGFNPNYLSGYFKQKTGQTLSYYINSERMKYAKKLLESGQYRVRDVSEKVGYEDAFYFSRCFKRYFGYSPKKMPDEI